MANRVITFKVTDIVSGEELVFYYDADTKVLSYPDSYKYHQAIQVKVVSDA